jgi:phage tail-like protein
VADELTTERRPGTLSGRIVPTGWVAPDPTHAWCFGSDEPGWTGRFKSGETTSIMQIGHLGSATRLIRSRARLRGPSTIPAGWRWEAIGRIQAGGVGPFEAWTFELTPGRTRDLSDLAITRQGFHSATDTDLIFALRVIGPVGVTDAVELEIPAFYLDSNALDTAAADLVIANRSPEPGGAQVPQDEAIQFDLISTTSTDSPDLSTVLVYVNGVLAYDGSSGEQPGYTVTVSEPLDNVVRLNVVAPYLFDPLSVVTVHVIADSTAGVHIDSEWSFTIADLIGPRVAAASSIEHELVRVTWDEPVSDTALVAANYRFSRLEAPGVDVSAVSVARFSQSAVDITLNQRITRGILYEVFASNVEDLFGNVVVAPYDRAEFRGFDCDQPAGRDFNLWTMIPRINRQQDDEGTRDLYKFLACLQEIVDLLLCDVDRWTEILDPDVAAERYLDQMLIELGNPFAFDLTADEKRRLIHVLVSMYQLKGTARGVIDVIRFFVGLDVTILAYLGAGDTWTMGESELGVDTTLGPSDSRSRFSFRVVSAIALTDEQRDRIREIANYMKPGHTHLVAIDEPAPPVSIDHWELGLSELGTETLLH